MHSDDGLWFDVELRGTITRDIRHIIINATDETDARAIVGEQSPTYRIHEIRVAR